MVNAWNFFTARQAPGRRHAARAHKRAAYLEALESRVLLTGNPPALAGVLLDHSTILENDSVVLSGVVSDLDDPDTFVLNVDWGQGETASSVSLGSAAISSPGVTWDPVTRAFAVSHQYLDDNPSGTPSDNYTVATYVTDSDNNSSSTVTQALVVQNVAPTVTASLDHTTIDEHGQVVLSGDVHDPGTQDRFFLSVHWGGHEDPQVLFLLDQAFNFGGIFWDPVTRHFSVAHQYELPNNSVSSYQLTMNLTDDDGGASGSVTAQVTVNNVAPTVSLQASASVLTGGTLVASGSFTDPGIYDGPWTATVDYGDGAGAQPLTLATNQTFTLSHTYATPGAYPVIVEVDDHPISFDGSSAPADSLAGTASMMTFVSNSVAGRSIFYGGSAYDAGGHDHAIAPDKSALLPGQTACLANYTSYDRGINGLMVDITGSVQTLSSSDFMLKVGNGNDLNAWTAVAAPLTVNLRTGAGLGGSNRIELTLPDGAVTNEWLQVTVLAGPDTGLTQDDVFYFGNAIGETGNSLSDAKVTTVDEAGTVAYAGNLTGSDALTIVNLYDINRDKVVNGLDEDAVAGHYTFSLTALKLIAPAAGAQNNVIWSRPDAQPSVAGGGGLAGGGSSLAGGSGGISASLAVKTGNGNSIPSSPSVGSDSKKHGRKKPVVVHISKPRKPPQASDAEAVTPIRISRASRPLARLFTNSPWNKIYRDDLKNIL